METNTSKKVELKNSIKLFSSVLAAFSFFVTLIIYIQAVISNLFFGITVAIIIMLHLVWFILKWKNDWTYNNKPLWGLSLAISWIIFLPILGVFIYNIFQKPLKGPPSFQQKIVVLEPEPEEYLTNQDPDGSFYDLARGLMYMNKQTGHAPQYEKAYELIKKSFEKGNKHAKFHMGDFYYFGYIEKQNFNTAKYYFEDAAKDGVADGYTGLVRLYRNKQYAYFDEDIAKEYVRLGAEAGSISCQLEIATTLRHENRIDSARYWFSKLADSGHADSQYYLANYHLNELIDDPEDINDPAFQGVVAGAKTGYKWINKLIEKNDSRGYFLHGLRLRIGKTNKERVETSFFNIKKAADMGYAEAQYLMARIYSGRESFYSLIEKNQILAIEYCRKASLQGSSEATDLLTELMADLLSAY